jgi:PIN domain nuclease of toxin-antitoxin system
MPIAVAHAAVLTILPFYHNDPFDRLIAATALIDGLTLISADSAFDAYGEARIW